MSARRFEPSDSIQSVTVDARQTRLSLSPGQVRIRPNGIEFRSLTPISVWTEMTVTLQSPRDTGRVHCTGVVIACNGNRHDGYSVSMVFTSLSKQSQAKLNQLAFS